MQESDFSVQVIPEIKPPTLEQWTRLYESAAVIKKMAPWKRLWDGDLITIMLPDREEPVYCSIMGRIEECYGIGIYPGYGSISGYMRMARAPAGEPAHISFFQQNCLMCYFGDREELMPRDREVLKALDLRFRGKNQWIYFRAMQTGFYPWFLSAEQAEIMIQALSNLAMAYRQYQDGSVTVDFAGGETLLHAYSPEEGLWLDTAARIEPVQREKQKLIVRDELLVARLKKQKKGRMRLEFDLMYLPTPIQPRRDEIPYLPRMALVADRESRLPLGQYMAEPEESGETIVLSILRDCVMKFGRPLELYVRDDRVACYVADLCEKIHVRLIQDEEVPVIDGLIEEMLAYIG